MDKDKMESDLRLKYGIALQSLQSFAIMTFTSQMLPHSLFGQHLAKECLYTFLEQNVTRKSWILTPTSTALERVSQRKATYTG